jgi:hypothetical protein
MSVSDSLAEGRAMMQTYPDFFQKDNPDALQSQVSWLKGELGLNDQFFARVLQVPKIDLAKLEGHTTRLSSRDLSTLHEFSRMVLHILSFLGSDITKVKALFEAPASRDKSAPLSPVAPPWAGSTLRSYLEQSGQPAIKAVSNWVACLRFGDFDAGVDSLRIAQDPSADSPRKQKKR